jgi:plastocyanin
VFKGGRVVKARHLIPAAIATLALAAAIVALPAAAGAGTLTKTKKVGVGDDFYAPTKVQVAKGGTVKWTWASANRHPHSVTLTKGPKGTKIKKFRSQVRVSGYSFQRQFKVPGTYSFHCVVHPTSMRMKVVVGG